MPKEFKNFIKKIATKPFEVNQFNSTNIKIKLLPFEKCHVSLLTICKTEKKKIKFIII